MLDYEVKDLSEAELEHKIRSQPNLIENGLKLVSSQRKAGRGPLDLLLVDSGNALVVVELKVTTDDDMLVQALDYYDYVYSNLEKLALAYQVTGLRINPYEDPRIMLIAPDFSQSLVNRCKWLNVKIDLYRFRCLLVKKDGAEMGELINFLPVEIPPMPKREEVFTESKVLSYITKPTLRDVAKELLAEIQKWNDVRIDPIRGALSIKIKKDVFSYFYPIRDGFHIYGYLSGHEEWQRLATVKSRDDLKEAIQKAKEAYDNIKQN